MLRAFGWFTLLAGGLPIVGFGLALWRGDRIGRWLAIAGGVWLAFFLLSPQKNIHYFMPIAFLPVATALRATAGRGRLPSLVFPAALTVSAIACIVLCRPASQPPYTADREFGRRTIFLAASEREAVDYSTGPIVWGEPG